MAQIDPETLKALITAGTGAGAGTVLKSITQPEANLKDWLIQSTSAIIVGALFGLAVTEWAHLGQFTGIAAASVGSLISEQIISFFTTRGKKLAKGEIDISMEGK